MADYSFKTFKAGRIRQVALTTVDDLEHLRELDFKNWLVVSLPVAGVRYDARALELLDTDRDGRIRFDEVLAALDFLKARGVDLGELFDPPKDLPERLEAARAKGDADEERSILYRLNLLELLENFVNMRRLYDPSVRAIFQTGTLWIDARELTFCCTVADEEAHAALAEHSNCCLLYAKLTRPSEGEEAVRTICAAVTAGSIGALYVGRNGVFSDRDGKIWEATVTKVVEKQVSLAEAFWAPWKSIGEAVSAAFAKVLGNRQAAATAAVKALGTQPPALPAAAPAAAAPAANPAGGAALASSVAAIGIGVGMVGAAAASLMAALARLNALQTAGAVLALFALVSLPSVILAWFRLRRRDLGAILNASGWAVNRPLRLTRRLARVFTQSL